MTAVTAGARKQSTVAGSSRTGPGIARKADGAQPRAGSVRPTSSGQLPRARLASSAGRRLINTNNGVTNNTSSNGRGSRTGSNAMMAASPSTGHGRSPNAAETNTNFGADLGAPIGGSLPTLSDATAALPPLPPPPPRPLTSFPAYAKPTNDEFALLAAAEDGDVDKVYQLVWKGTNVDCRRPVFGTTPLALAAKKGHLPVVAILLEAGARMGKGDEFGVTPLHWAANHGHNDIITAMVARATAPTVGPRRLFRPATAAAGSSPVLSASTTTPPLHASHPPPLHHASGDAGGGRGTKHARSKDALITGDEGGGLRMGSSSNAIGTANDGGGGNGEGEDADANHLAAKDHFGSTPLHFAAVNNDEKTVFQLITAGSDCTLRNNDGHRPQDVTTSEALRSFLADEEAKILKYQAYRFPAPVVVANKGKIRKKKRKGSGRRKKGRAVGSALSSSSSRRAATAGGNNEDGSGVGASRPKRVGSAGSSGRKRIGSAGQKRTKVDSAGRESTVPRRIGHDGGQTGASSAASLLAFGAKAKQWVQVKPQAEGPPARGGIKNAPSAVKRSTESIGAKKAKYSGETTLTGRAVSVSTGQLGSSSIARGSDSKLATPKKTVVISNKVTKREIEPELPPIGGDVEVTFAGLALEDGHLNEKNVLMEAV